MKHPLALVALTFLLGFAGCGSDDTSSGGTGGTGGSKGTTCADGYPTLDTPCAILNETCKACGSGYACCDIFQCQSTGWAQLQSHATCPPDAGPDAPSDAGPDASSDAGSDASSDAGSDVAFD